VARCGRLAGVLPGLMGGKGLWVHCVRAHGPSLAPPDQTSTKAPVTPAERFAPVPAGQRDLVGLWLPAALESASAPRPADPADPTAASPPAPAKRAEWNGGPVEFDRVVPQSGNMIVCQRQFWMGPHRAGMVARIWAGCDLIHVLISGTRIKTVRSHLSVNDLARLIAQGAVPDGPSPLPPVEDGGAVEVECCVSRLGLVSLGGRQLLAAEILGGRRAGIRIEPRHTDVLRPGRPRAAPHPQEAPDPRAGQRPARRPPRRAPPRPSAEPVRVQRRASNTGVIMVVGQKIALGRIHKHQTITVLVSKTTLTVEFDDGDVRGIRLPTTQPVRSIKGQRSRTATSVS
jgi:hypothetical protein